MADPSFEIFDLLRQVWRLKLRRGTVLCLVLGLEQRSTKNFRFCRVQLLVAGTRARIVSKSRSILVLCVYVQIQTYTYPYVCAITSSIQRAVAKCSCLRASRAISRLSLIFPFESLSIVRAISVQPHMQALPIKD